MRLTVLPLTLPLLLITACKDGGSDDAPVTETAPTVAKQPDAPIESSRHPEVRIAGNAAGAVLPTPEQQDLLPLASVLGIARRRVPGEIIDVDLDGDEGRMTYEVEVLTAAGRKIEIKIDARKGTVLEVEED